MLRTNVVEAFDAVVCVVFVGKGVKRAECQLLKALQIICASVRLPMRKSLSHQPQRFFVEFWQQPTTANGAIPHDVAKKQRPINSFAVTR